MDVVPGDAGDRVDRRVHDGRPDASEAAAGLPGDPLVRGVESSLAEVEHQIWLLRNVHWWYLLPLAVPMLAFFAHTFWRLSRGNVWEAAIATSFVTVVVGGVYTWIYWINQKAVRSTLEPRRQELTSMLRSLSDEPPPS